MSVPRACVLARSFLSRGSLASSRKFNPVLLSNRIAFPYRQFTSSIRFLQEATQTPLTESPSASPLRVDPSNPNARIVTLMKIDRRATKSEIEALFENAGLQVTKIQMRIDRFTFHNDTYAFVELASPEQAQDAVEKLNPQKLRNKPFHVRPTVAEFAWQKNVDGGKDRSEPTRYFYCDPSGIQKAIQPLLQGRRIHFAVKTPGFGAKHLPVSERVAESMRAIRRNLSKFGIEAIGHIAVNYGDMKLRPRYLCHIDFQTVEGAEDAIKTLDGTEIEGKLVELKKAKAADWRAYQIGRVDPNALTQLQEQDIASKDFSAEKYARTYSKNRPKNVNRG